MLFMTLRLYFVCQYLHVPVMLVFSSVDFESKARTARTSACTRARTCARTQGSTHARTTHACTHTRVSAHTHARTARTHAHTHALVRARTRACAGEQRQRALVDVPRDVLPREPRGPVLLCLVLGHNCLVRRRKPCIPNPKPHPELPTPSRRLGRDSPVHRNLQRWESRASATLKRKSKTVSRFRS
jgi:hypothetical protein